jgi:hypothetical protein
LFIRLRRETRETAAEAGKRPSGREAGAFREPRRIHSAEANAA